MAVVESRFGAVVQEGDHLSANLGAAVAGVELPEGLGHISDHGCGRYRRYGSVPADRFDDSGEARQHGVGEGGRDEGRSVV